MDKVLSTYSYILGEYLSRCFENQQSINPLELNKERFKTKAVFIAAIIFLQSNPNRADGKIASKSNEWLKKSFADENLFSTIIDNASKVLENLVDDNVSNLIGIESVDISTLYEALLSIETGNENKGTEITTAKNYRNKLGSYYTPLNFAKTVTSNTIEAFFELNFGIKKISTTNIEDIDKNILKEINSISFADFSCGGGNFISAVICYFEKLFSKWRIEGEIKIGLLKGIAMNISAFDVDCIALEIAKLNMLLQIQQPLLYQTVSKNFVHANFLLQSDYIVDESKKVEIFSSGFIYHELLSLSRGRLKRYDIVLGNPPWEKIRFEEKKFYALYSSTIAENHFKSSRINEIDEIELSNVHLAEYSKQFKFEIEKAKSDLKKNSLFGLSNNGELNTYALFTDAALKLISERGVFGLVLKSAIVTSQVNQILFKHLAKNDLIVAVYDFINRKKIFNIDSRERFCFLLVGNSQRKKFKVSMNLCDVDDIEKAMSEIEMTYDGLMLLNPITGMLPNFSTKKEADFLLRVSNDFPFFNELFENIKFGRIVHFTSHAEYISKKKSDDNLPIYEGKFFYQFDGKFSGFNGVGDDLRYGNKSSSLNFDESKKEMADYLPESRFFISKEKWEQLSKNHHEQFMLAWRSLTSATNTRTCIATILPFIPASQSVQFLTTNQDDLLYLAGLFNSVVFDFILKKKLSGIDLTQSVINQMPVPDFDQLDMCIDYGGQEATIKEHISLLVFSLLNNDIRLYLLFEKLNLKPAVSESRFELIRRIDLFFMLLYKLTDFEIELVLAEFSKQYSKEDLNWFKCSLASIRLNKAISSASSCVTHLTPN